MRFSLKETHPHPQFFFYLHIDNTNIHQYSSRVYYIFSSPIPQKKKSVSKSTRRRESQPPKKIFTFHRPVRPSSLYSAYRITRYFKYSPLYVHARNCRRTRIYAEEERDLFTLSHISSSVRPSRETRSPSGRTAILLL